MEPPPAYEKLDAQACIPTEPCIQDNETNNRGESIIEMGSSERPTTPQKSKGVSSEKMTGYLLCCLGLGLLVGTGIWTNLNEKFGTSYEKLMDAASDEFIEDMHCAIDRYPGVPCGWMADQLQMATNPEFLPIRYAVQQRKIITTVEKVMAKWCKTNNRGLFRDNQVLSQTLAMTFCKYLKEVDAADAAYPNKDNSEWFYNKIYPAELTLLNALL